MTKGNNLENKEFPIGKSQEQWSLMNERATPREHNGSRVWQHPCSWNGTLKMFAQQGCRIAMDQYLLSIFICPFLSGTGYCGYPIPVLPLNIGQREEKTYF